MLGPYEFCLTNDIDHGTLDEMLVIYELLNRSDIKCTTAIFCEVVETSLPGLGQHCRPGETVDLRDPNFISFIKDMKTCGHEFAYHGFSQISNTREQFIKGLDIFSDKLGFEPRVYIEHGGKKGHHVDSMCKKESLAYFGRDPASQFFVADVIAERFDLVWTQDQLIVEAPEGRHALIYDDGLPMFNRVRNVDLFNDLKGLDVVCGYTHFGYPGYSRPQKDWIPFYKSRGRKVETWKGRSQAKQAVSTLKRFLTKTGRRSTTLSCATSLSKNV